MAAVNDSFSLLYADPNARIEGKEKNSKLLATESDLYKKLDALLSAICTRFPLCTGKRMDFHTELVRSGNPTELVERAQKLHGAIVTLSDLEKWTIMSGRAFVFNTPAVDGYGPTHITVGYWRDPATTPALGDLKDLVLEVLGRPRIRVIPDIRFRQLVAGEFEPDISSVWDDYGPYRQVSRPADLIPYLIEERRAEEEEEWNVVGVITYHMVSYGPTFAAFNIGIGLIESARGRGIGSHAQKKFAEMLFQTTGVYRIEAATDVENIAEQRALEKAGFVREGKLRGAQFRADKIYHDMYMYAITRKDVGIQFSEEIRTNLGLSI